MEQTIRLGQEPAPDYVNRPTVEPRFRWLYTAFQKLRLNTAEVAGMGAAIGAITPSEIVAWCDLNRIDSEESRQAVYEVVTSLDALWLAERVAKKPEDSGENDDGS